MKTILITILIASSFSVGTRQMKEKTGVENKERVRLFFQLLEEENIEGVVDLFAENGRQINPYASGLFPYETHGKKALMEYWSPVPENFDGMQFTIHELYAMEDPTKVFVKYSGKITLKNGAGYYENDYYSTFSFNEEGKIVEYVEIFNPIIAAKAFNLLDKIK